MDGHHFRKLTCSFRSLCGTFFNTEQYDPIQDDKLLCSTDRQVLIKILFQLQTLKSRLRVCMTHYSCNLVSKKSIRVKFPPWGDNGGDVSGG